MTKQGYPTDGTDEGNRLVAGSPANLRAIAEADALLASVTALAERMDARRTDG